MRAGLRIGLDFDNTIITYDDVFLSTAQEWSLVGSDFIGRKQAVRDAIRLLPDGELLWQRLQGQVYGRGLAKAKMLEGVESLLHCCRVTTAPVMIAPHT